MSDQPPIPTSGKPHLIGLIIILIASLLTLVLWLLLHDRLKGSEEATNWMEFQEQLDKIIHNDRLKRNEGSASARRQAVPAQRQDKPEPKSVQRPAVSIPPVAPDRANAAAASDREKPTIEQVYENPERYKGKSLVFEDVQLRGTTQLGANKQDLYYSVKSATGTVYAPTSDGRGNGISFQSQVDEKAASLPAVDAYFAATIRCTIAKNTDGNWVAHVTRVELLKPRLFVLSIGIDVLQGKQADSCVKDATAVEQLFSRLGKSVFRRVETQSLTGNAADRSAICRGIERLQRVATASDVVVIYCSIGSGLDAVDGYYLVPKGGRDQGWKRKVIWAAELGEELQNIPGTVVVLLDANNAGALLKQDWGKVKPGPVIVCAASAKEASLGDANNRYLAAAVIEGLKGRAAKNGNGEVTLDGLIRYIEQRLPALTKNQQHPVVRRPNGLELQSVALTKP
jgi:hypothetical protein